MRISELYPADQGEGAFAGTPSVFVRTTGCNLRCWFCDSPFTSWGPVGDDVPVDVIAERVSTFGIEHVVITGGEPLLPREMTELTRTLKDAGHYITIETAGTVYRDVSVDLLSISPKLSNSSPLQDVRWAARHNLNRVRPEIVAVLLSRFKYQLKFVVDKPEDLDEIEEYLAPIANVDRHRVWLMPQAVTREQLAEKSHWLKLLADEHHFRFSSRLHIEAFGNVRGK